MRSGLVGLIWLVACYSPAIPAEVPCSPGGQCPDGQSCTPAGVCVIASANQPDAALPGDDASQASDGDGDTVADASDNCPSAANTDQANEDGDTFGDACDLCPQQADSAAVDADGDQAGDACDPNPTLRDSVWLFESFRGGLPAWAGSVNWTVASDAVRVVAPGVPTPRNEYLVLPLTRPGRTAFDNFRITASVVVEQTGSASDREAGITVYDTNTNPVRALGCELGDFNGDRILLLWDDVDLERFVDFSWTNGTQYQLRLTRHGANYTCDVTPPGGTTMSLTGSSPIVPRTGASMEIWAYGLTAQYRSVGVIGSP